jgi:hypothetical protein
VVDSKTAEDKQTNKGGTPAKPKSSKSVAFASSTKEDELVADTNSDEGGITSSKPDRVEDRGEEEEPPVVEREELLNLLDTLQSRMAELERRATEAEAGLQISKSSKGSRRKRYSKESETDDDSDSSLEGISLRDTSAAADIITKLHDSKKEYIEDVKLLLANSEFSNQEKINHLFDKSNDNLLSKTTLLSV